MSDTTKALQQIQGKLVPAVEKAMDEIAKVAQQHARNTNLFKGHVLKDNIIILKNGAMARTVLANKDYAYYLEYGNNQKGDFIYPTNKKVLHFYANGTEVFAAKVKAHGPLPFMEEAGKFAEGKATAIMEKYLGEILK